MIKGFLQDIRVFAFASAGRIVSAAHANLIKPFAGIKSECGVV